MVRAETQTVKTGYNTYMEKKEREGMAMIKKKTIRKELSYTHTYIIPTYRSYIFSFLVLMVAD